MNKQAYVRKGLLRRLSFLTLFLSVTAFAAPGGRLLEILGQAKKAQVSCQESFGGLEANRGGGFENYESSSQPVEIKTARFTLKPVTTNDFEAVKKIWGNEEVAKMSGDYMDDHSILSLLAHGRPNFNHFERGAIVNLGIYDGDKLVGMSQLAVTPPEREMMKGIAEYNEKWAEISYHISPDYWSSNGKHEGVATEVAQALVKKAFDDLGVNGVHGQAIVTNVGSQKVLQNAGLVEIDRFIDPQPWSSTGGSVYLSATRAQYEAKHGKAPAVASVPVSNDTTPSSDAKAPALAPKSQTFFTAEVEGDEHKGDFNFARISLNDDHAVVTTGSFDGSTYYYNVKKTKDGFTLVPIETDKWWIKAGKEIHIRVTDPSEAGSLTELLAKGKLTIIGSPLGNDGKVYTATGFQKETADLSEIFPAKVPAATSSNIDFSKSAKALGKLGEGRFQETPGFDWSRDVVRPQLKRIVEADPNLSEHFTGNVLEKALDAFLDFHNNGKSVEQILREVHEAQGVAPVSQKPETRGGDRNSPVSSAGFEPFNVMVSHTPSTTAQINEWQTTLKDVNRELGYDWWLHAQKAISMKESPAGVLGQLDTELASQRAMLEELPKPVPSGPYRIVTPGKNGKYYSDVERKIQRLENLRERVAKSSLSQPERDHAALAERVNKHLKPEAHLALDAAPEEIIKKAEGIKQWQAQFGRMFKGEPSELELNMLRECDEIIASAKAIAASRKP